MVKVVLIFVLIFISLHDQVMSEWCPEMGNEQHECKGIPHEGENYIFEEGRWDGCTSRFCADGSTMGPNDKCCGKGACNILCRNCDGGCRGNADTSYSQAAENFRSRYGL